MNRVSPDRGGEQRAHRRRGSFLGPVKRERAAGCSFGGHFPCAGPGGYAEPVLECRVWWADLNDVRAARVELLDGVESARRDRYLRAEDGGWRIERLGP